MDPDYVALVRVVIAETRRLPHLGQLFRSAVPERVLGNVSALLEAARENGAIGPVDTDAASRAFVGPLLTYVLLDGLFVGDGPPRPPGPERIEAAVDLFMGSIVNDPCSARRSDGRPERDHDEPRGATPWVAGPGTR